MKRCRAKARPCEVLPRAAVASVLKLSIFLPHEVRRYTVHCDVMGNHGKERRAQATTCAWGGVFFSFSFPPVPYMRLTPCHPPHHLGIIGV